MKNLYRFLLILHLFVGIGAIAGGMAAILNPMEPLGVSADILKNSPFDSFVVPGIILFAVIGVGNILCAVAILVKAKYQGYISGIFCSALVIWIVVQCIMLRGVHILHIIYFTIGLAGSGASAFIVFRQRLFPVNIILDFIKK